MICKEEQRQVYNSLIMDQDKNVECRPLMFRFFGGKKGPLRMIPEYLTRKMDTDRPKKSRA